MSSSLKIIVTGLIAQHPALGGMTWHYLHYLLGLKKLGHDVYYFEDSGQWPYNLDGGPSGNNWIAHDCKPNVDYLNAVLSRFGLGDRWAYRFPIESAWFGLSESRCKSVLASADILINVSGSLENPGDYRQIPRLVYIDTDPVFTQVKLMRGQEDFRRRVSTHDQHFTFGECLSEEAYPSEFQWRPTRQPILLSEWHPSPHPRKVFTTVMNWTSYEPLTHAGKSYGQKDAEFKRFLELPRRIAPGRLEVALSRTEHVNWRTQDDNMPPAVHRVAVDNPDWSYRDLLLHTGWQVADATEVCGDLDCYRSYIESSMAEWTVAKHGYVVGQPGWFSDRSACYLAAGKPIVVQDTGFSRTLPVGEGILSFRDLDEAVDSVQKVTKDYSRHAHAAREIAEQYFDAEKVLGRLVEHAMNPPSEGHIAGTASRQLVESWEDK